MLLFEGENQMKYQEAKGNFHQCGQLIIKDPKVQCLAEGKTLKQNKHALLEDYLPDRYQGLK